MSDPCATVGGERSGIRRSVPELAEEAAQLERSAKQQLLDLTGIFDVQLQQLIAIYERACGNVARLQIESEIRKARSLLEDVRKLAMEGRR